MKVLEDKSGELAAFQYEHVCECCESRLLVDHNDLRYSPGYRSMGQGPDGPESFHAKCDVCKTDFTVPLTVIPKYVKFHVRDRRNNQR